MYSIIMVYVILFDVGIGFCFEIVVDLTPRFGGCRVALRDLLEVVASNTKPRITTSHWDT